MMQVRASLLWIGPLWLALSLAQTGLFAQPVTIELVADVCPGPCAGYDYYQFDNFGSDASRFYFAGNDPAFGTEPWVTDGTAAGTRMLADIRPGTEGSYPHPFVTIGNVLFFVASTPAMSGWSEGTRLWRSDGTPEGTAPVDFPVPAPKAVFTADGYNTIHATSTGLVMPSTQGVWWVPADGSMPRKLVDAYLITSRVAEWNGGVHFITAACTAFCAPGTLAADLYRFDPRGALTRIATLAVEVSADGMRGPVAQIAAGPAGIFLSPQTGELWFTGGIVAPALLRRWPPGGGLYLDDVPGYGGAFVFTASEDAYSGALWTSDGTAQGTRALTSFTRLPYHEAPSNLGFVNGAIVVGIPLVYVPGGYADAPNYSFYADLGVLDAAAPLGVRPLRSLTPPNARADIRNAVPFDRGLLFRAQGSTGSSPSTGDSLLWVTDGTAGGTQPVDPQFFADVAPIKFLRHVNGWTYFAGWQKGTGYELYRMKFATGYPPSFPTVEVTEYYHAGFDHYFMTGNPAEKANLDSGATVGWKRTGFGFNAYAAGSGVPGISPVCRFYGRPEAGLDSHFYSGSPAECAAVEARFSNAWIKEATDVFEVALPDAQTGWCAWPSAPLYRAYNGRADVNHRYSVHASDQKAMQGKGWTPEGSTSAGIAMCVLAGMRP